jgi:lysozyme
MNSFAKRCAVVAVLAFATLLPKFQTLKTSSDGLALIANAEGCRTSPYQCSAGVWTNGIGHTLGVTPASQISEQQAAVNLIDDVIRVERGLAQCMPVAMPQRVYDAAVSFGFNVGVRAVCRSTFARYINALHWQAACNELRRWVYVDGKVNRGLQNRRATETAYCLKGLQ